MDLEFLKYFPLPWKSDQCVFIWSSNNTTPLQESTQDYNDLSENFLNVAADIINGVTKGTFPNAVYNPETQEITADECNILLVRGWGYLRGVHNLSDYEAVKIQDTMGEWVAAKLAGRI